jgi:hypothetical protein
MTDVIRTRILLTRIEDWEQVAMVQVSFLLTYDLSIQ